MTSHPEENTAGSMRPFLARACAVEEAVVFESDGQSVRGMLYLPERTPAPAVLVAHGFTGSRNADQRMLVWITRALAHHGVAAMTIDFRGSGESEGDFADMTPETEIADARRALDLLQNDARIDGERLGMVGHSLGGMVTACVCGDDPRLRAVALLCAVGEARLFWTKRLELEERDRCDTHGCDVGGLEVGKAFYQIAVEMDPQARFAASDSPALIIHGTADESVPFAHAEAYAAACAAAGRAHRLLPVEGADHCFRSIPWREELIAAVVGWFGEHLSERSL